MKFILGTKLHMTHIFEDDGAMIPVTVVQAGPCFVSQIKIKEKDGYNAIQIGYKPTKEKHLTSPMKGHLKPTGQLLKNLREFGDDITKTSFKIGDCLTVDIFKKGDKVKVTSTSKGRGFQGVVKRHGFHGAPATHGHKDQLRMPGSIGATDPQRVFKGKRMAGHMGANSVSVKNVEIAYVNSQKGELFLKGAVPGARGALIKIQSI